MGSVRFVAAACGVVSDGVPIAADGGPYIRLPCVHGRPGPRPKGLVRIGVCKGTCSLSIRFLSSVHSICSSQRHSFARKAHVHHSPTACVQGNLSSGSRSFAKGTYPGLTPTVFPIEPKFDWKLRSGSRKPRGPPRISPPANPPRVSVRFSTSSYLPSLTFRFHHPIPAEDPDKARIRPSGYVPPSFLGHRSRTGAVRTCIGVLVVAFVSPLFRGTSARVVARVGRLRRASGPWLHRRTPSR